MRASYEGTGTPNTDQFNQRIKRVDVLYEPCSELSALACLGVTTKRGGEGEDDRCLPDILFTEHCPFLLFLFGTFGHLGGGRGRKVDNVTAWKNQHWWKNTLLFLYQLLIHHLWLVCPFLTVYSTTKSTLNIIASSFHRIKQSKSQRYFHVICNSLMCKHSHLRH